MGGTNRDSALPGFHGAVPNLDCAVRMRRRLELHFALGRHIGCASVDTLVERSAGCLLDNLVVFGTVGFGDKAVAVAHIAGDRNIVVSFAVAHD